jgi:dihydroorotate dehydrogenase
VADTNNGQKVGLNGRPNVPVKILLRDLRRFVDQMISPEARQQAIDWLGSVEGTLDATAMAEKPSEAILNNFVRLCVLGRLQPLLAAYEIPHPAYNYFEDFLNNAPGPWDSLPQGWLASTPAVWPVLGYDVGFPIGVPASVLTATADWIEYYARHGFNVLTYKTVRSEQWDAHDEPNWVFLNDGQAPFSPDGERLPDHVQADLSVWPRNPRAFSMANSFGVPSFPPDVWQKDVAESLRRLQSHQLLIVSVMATTEKFEGQEMVRDFVRVAKLAEEAGAPAIELNLSCPNTLDPNTGSIKRPLCNSPEDTERIVTEVRSSLKAETRLVMKLGYMRHDLLEKVVRPIAKLIDGVSGINTLQVNVRRQDGQATFPGRDEAGISGSAIRDFGLRFVESLNRIRQEHALQFDIIGMGGVMNADDVFAFQRAGAAAIQTATLAFLNANLPQEIYRQLGGAATSETELQARSEILELLSHDAMPLTEVAKHIQKLFPLEWTSLEKARTVLRELEASGMVVANRENGRVMFRRASVGDVELAR